jgi:hypothetical protein
MYNGEPIGYIEYIVDKESDSVVNITAINFSKKYSYTFGKDVTFIVKNVVKMFRKVSCSVIVGNSAEPSYDRLAKRLGFRIVGILRRQVLLADMQWHDLKLYEYVRDEKVVA